MAKSVLVLITKPPYGFEEAFAGSRLALAMLSSGNVDKCNIILAGDGTLNAVATQKPEAVRMPSNMEALGDMVDFDAKVYCVRSDLLERVGEVETLDFIEMIDWAQAKKIIDEHDMVTTF
ncbi:MAG: DsrE family protein [Methanomassiliicoccales archaeon]|nr:MAG: DsrE family protein [Methanomassiliicoccales archaeon]